MQPQSNDAPRLAIAVHPLPPGPWSEKPSLSDTSADLPLLGGGRLCLTKGRNVADYYLSSRPSDEDLLHPYVAPAAALFWQWSGREAIHGGAFEAGSGAVLLLGDKEDGKSTTLGWLARQGGISVLTDDLAVMDGNRVLAGPRSIDLRITAGDPGLAPHLVRHGDRDRVRLPSSPASQPLIGVAVLAWGSAIALDPIPFADRVPLLAQQRTFPGLAPSAVALLEVASAPMIRASRPRRLASLEPFARALVDYFS